MVQLKQDLYSDRSCREMLVSRFVIPHFLKQLLWTRPKELNGKKYLYTNCRITETP